MSSIGHSTGLLLLDGSTVEDNDNYSFRAGGGGSTADEFLGWGHSVSYPEMAVNPPEGAVHVVYVEELDDGAKSAIRELAGEHVLRYGECRIFTYPEIGPIAAWIAAGSPDPSDEEQTEVADSILAAQAGQVVNQPEPSLVANSELPGTEVEFVADPSVGPVDEEEAMTGDEAWDTEGDGGGEAPPDGARAQAENLPEQVDGVAADAAGVNAGVEAVSVNPEADAQPGEAVGENVAGEPATNPTKRALPDT